LSTSIYILNYISLGEEEAGGQFGHGLHGHRLGLPHLPLSEVKSPHFFVAPPPSFQSGLSAEKFKGSEQEKAAKSSAFCL